MVNVIGSNPKEEYLLKVAEDFLKIFDAETAEVALHIVDKNLYNYEITDKETGLAVRDTFTERVLKIYIGSKKLEGKSEKSIAQYYREINHLLNFLQCPINEVTTNGIKLYLSESKMQRNLQNSTVENMRSYISSVFTWLTMNQYLQFNPAAAIPPIKVEDVIRKSFSNEEMAALRAACRDDRERFIIEFLYSTGCRVSEAVSVNIEDIDILHRELIVTGKGNKQRKVYLNKTALYYFQKYMKDKEGPLFTSISGPYKGRRLSCSGMEYILNQLGARANVQHVHPHRFRRTLATDLLNKGMAIADVSKLLGHANIAITQRYYYHTDEKVRSAFNIFMD